MVLMLTDVDCVTFLTDVFGVNVRIVKGVKKGGIFIKFFFNIIRAL